VSPKVTTFYTENNPISSNRGIVFGDVDTSSLTLLGSQTIASADDTWSMDIEFATYDGTVYKSSNTKALLSSSYQHLGVNADLYAAWRATLQY